MPRCTGFAGASVRRAIPPPEQQLSRQDPADYKFSIHGKFSMKGAPMNPLTDSSLWKTIEPGVRLFRLWVTTGPEQPQIAVLQLSSEKYQELRKNVKAFLDSRNIFFESVRPGAALTEMLTPSAEYNGEWIVAIVHRESKARGASYPSEGA
jgi:hypothetical protein